MPVDWVPSIHPEGALYFSRMHEGKVRVNSFLSLMICWCTSFATANSYKRKPLRCWGARRHQCMCCPDRCNDFWQECPSTSQPRTCLGANSGWWSWSHVWILFCWSWKPLFILGWTNWDECSLDGSQGCDLSKPHQCVFPDFLPFLLVSLLQLPGHEMGAQYWCVQKRTCSSWFWNRHQGTLAPIPGCPWITSHNCQRVEGYSHICHGW